MAAKRAQHSARGAIQKQHQPSAMAKKKCKTKGNSSMKAKKALVTQEVKLARLLASNDKKVREKILKHLRKWLTARARSPFAFTETDFMRLWKGLFYCMWMSDKPLIQEELAESLSKVVHCFHAKDVVFLYTKCALMTLATEWFGIDQYRLDKFAMLARRIMRQTFQICKDKSSWNIEWVQEFCQVINEILLDPKTSLGFSMHITELFFEELAKISAGDLPKEAVTEFVKPFTEQLVRLDDERQIKHIMKHIFRYLIFQSDVGMEYTEKFNAWKEAGFPSGHIDAMEKLELSSENGELEDKNNPQLQDGEPSNLNKPLDPRAGRVDVELPQIMFDPKQIAELLTEYKFHPLSTAKSRRQILHLIKEFTELFEGNMPVGIKDVVLPDKKACKNNTKAAALRLLEFERDLHSDNAPNKRKRKHGVQVLDSEDSDEGSVEGQFSTDEDSEVECANEDAMDSDEEEIIPTNQGTKGGKAGANKKRNAHNSEDAPLQDEKNPRRTSDKRKRTEQSNKRSNTQAVNFEKKVPNLHHLGKKVKLRQKAFTATSLSGSKLPINKKESTMGKASGSWDVSENTNSIAATTKSSRSVVGSSSIKKRKPKSTLETPNKVKSVTATKSEEQNKLANGSESKKRVKIMLNKNTAQHTSEYIQKILQSPGIPFDADKKPLAGVLKASPIPSPINPFYRRAFK